MIIGKIKIYYREGKGTIVGIGTEAVNENVAAIPPPPLPVRDLVRLLVLGVVPNAQQHPGIISEDVVLLHPQILHQIPHPVPLPTHPDQVDLRQNHTKMKRHKKKRRRKLEAESFRGL